MSKKTSNLSNRNLRFINIFISLSAHLIDQSRAVWCVITNKICSLLIPIHKLNWTFPTTTEQLFTSLSKLHSAIYCSPSKQQPNPVHVGNYIVQQTPDWMMFTIRFYRFRGSSREQKWYFGGKRNPFQVPFTLLPPMLSISCQRSTDRNL